MDLLGHGSPWAFGEFLLVFEPWEHDLATESMAPSRSCTSVYSVLIPDSSLAKKSASEDEKMVSATRLVNDWYAEELSEHLMEHRTITESIKILT